MFGDSLIRRLGWVTGVAVLGVYIFVSLRGPYGVSALSRKRAEIRVLQEQNAELKREITELRNRNVRLRENPEEQDLEIRKRLKMLRKGERNFVVPETSRPPSR